MTHGHVAGPEADVAKGSWEGAMGVKGTQPDWRSSTGREGSPMTSPPPDRSLCDGCKELDSLHPAQQLGAAGEGGVWQS